MFDRLLRNVGQDCIGTSESNDRGFAEENSFVKNGVLCSEKNSGERERQRPDQDPRDGSLEDADERRTLRRWRKDALTGRCRSCTIVEGTEKESRQKFSANQADDPGADDDHRKWRAEKID